MTKTMERVIAAVKECWEGVNDLPFPDTHEEARKHETGDGLGCFVRIELEEGLEGYPEEEIQDRAIHLLNRAQEDLERAVVAIETMGEEDENGRDIDTEDDQ